MAEERYAVTVHLDSVRDLDDMMLQLVRVLRFFNETDITDPIKQLSHRTPKPLIYKGIKQYGSIEAVAK